MFVPLVRYHTINTSCQNLPKAIYKPLYPTPNSVMRFYSAIKQCKDGAAADANSQRRRRDRRPSARKATYTGQYRKRRKEVWKTVLRGNRRNQGKSPKRSLSRNSSHKTRKTSQKPPQKKTRRPSDDISHVYAVQCMPQRENRRCL